MVFGVILAGGVGSRMGNAQKPKQYLELGSKPILIHTIGKFMVHQEFQELIVLCPKPWMEHTKNIIEKYLPELGDHIVVLEGGSTRNETIMNSIAYIEKSYGLDDETIIVTHDSVRPFLTYRIIEENIEAARKYGACDTVIPATDTIVVSEDHQKITEIPERTKMYQGQTPQSFQAKKLRELYQSLTQQEKDILTDASKIFTMKGEPVYLVEGEVFNIKITYPYDLRVAQSLIKEQDI